MIWWKKIIRFLSYSIIILHAALRYFCFWLLSSILLLLLFQFTFHHDKVHTVSKNVQYIKRMWITKIFLSYSTCTAKWITGQWPLGHFNDPGHHGNSTQLSQMADKVLKTTTAVLYISPIFYLNIETMILSLDKTDIITYFLQYCKFFP